MDETRFEFEGHGGLTLVGDRWGEGRPVVFLHGGGQTRHSWGGAAKTLAGQGYATYTIDLRGHGESDWSPNAEYSLSSFARDLKAFCDTIDAKPVVVGASLGGLTTIVCEGRLFPGTAAGVVLVDIIPEMDEEGTDRIAEFMFDRVEEGFASLEEVADAVSAYNPHRPRPDNLDGLKKNLRHGDDGRWYWHWDPKFVGGGDRPGTGDHPSEMHETEALTAAVGAIEVPTMLVRGRMSDVVRADAAERFARRFPHITVSDVGGAGHMVAGDRNDVFADAVTDWLTEVRL